MKSKPPRRKNPRKRSRAKKAGCGSARKRGQFERESPATSARISKLEQELAATKKYLRSIIEAQEVANEELRSANEEILSSNKELQRTSEELETAREELRSASGKLTSANDELRSRNLEIVQVNDDLTNLLESIDIAVVIVGSDLTVRRFTPEARKFLGLIPSDIGHPLLNINPMIEIPEFQSLVLQVMSNFHLVEKEFSGKKGSRYRLRILPYRVVDNKINGVVITITVIPSYAPKLPNSAN